MKKISLLLIIMALGVWGCVSVDNSTIVDADQNGVATGQFRDIRHGQLCDFSVYGGGAAASAANSAAGAVTSVVGNNLTNGGPTSAATSSGGGGFLGLRVSPPPAQGDPLPFARSIAMINYAKKLKKVSYDDGGLVSFEFNGQAPQPSAFGHQPIR